MATWRAIPGFEGSYEVSSDGQVRSLDRAIHYADGRIHTHRGVLLRPGVNQVSSYKHVNLQMRDTRASYYVHDLVCLAFVGPKPTKYEVCHNDGDRHNNCLSNLRYGTRAENAADRRRHGTWQVGENCGGHKLVEDQVLEIRGMIADGFSLRIIAKRFGVSNSCIQSIRNGSTWFYLGPVVRGDQHQAAGPQTAKEAA